MERPKCEIPDCERPAGWLLRLHHDRKAWLTCDDHRDRWYDKGGYGCIVAPLGACRWVDDKTIEEHFCDNQARAAKRGG